MPCGNLAVMRVLLVQGISPSAYWGYSHSLPPSSARVRRTRPSASRCSPPAHLGAAHQVSAPLAGGGRGAPPRGRRPRLRHAGPGVLDARDARPRGEAGQGHRGGWPGPHHHPRQLSRTHGTSSRERRKAGSIAWSRCWSAPASRRSACRHQGIARGSGPLHRGGRPPPARAPARGDPQRGHGRSSGASPLGQDGTEPWARAGRLLAPGPGGRTARVVRMWILP